MSILAIKNGIVSGVTNTFEAVKGFVAWGGRSIQSGYSNYLIPAIKSVWTGFINGLKATGNFLRTGPGIGFTAAAGLVAFGLSALRLSTSKDYVDADHRISQAAWRAIGLASFGAAAVAASASVALLVL